MNFFEMGLTAFSTTLDVATMSAFVAVEPVLANEAFTSSLGRKVQRPDAYVVYRCRSADIDAPEKVVDAFEAMVGGERDGFRRLVDASDLGLVEVVASLPAGRSWDCSLPPSVLELCVGLGVEARVTLTT